VVEAGTTTLYPMKEREYGADALKGNRGGEVVKRIVSQYSK
jgi:hypothetical protein